MRQALLLLALVLFSCAPSLAQSVAVRSPRPTNDTGTDPQFGQRRNGVNPDVQRMEHEREKRLNKERQAAIQRDTDKLLALATELKQYVDKTNENLLSLEVMKKAEEIEKLAHQVKERMKNSP